MTKFKRIINLIFNIISLIFLLTLFPILFNLGSFSDFANRYLTSNFGKGLTYIIFFIILVGTLIRIISNIIEKTDESFILLSDEDGEISVSERAIETTVKDTLRKFTDIVESYCDIKLKNNSKNDIVVSVKCGIEEDKSFNIDDLEQVREKIGQSVEDLLGITVSKINVKFYEVKKNNKKSMIEEIAHKTEYKKGSQVKRVK